MDKDLRKLIKALEAQGYEVTISTKQHPRVFLNGKLITTLASTPSDRRSWSNGLNKLRRSGFRWPRG